jgi:hypothetical protein
MRLEEEFAGQSQHGTSNNLALAYLELGDYERAQVGPIHISIIYIYIYTYVLYVSYICS